MPGTAHKAAFAAAAGVFGILALGARAPERGATPAFRGQLLLSTDDLIESVGAAVVIVSAGKVTDTEEEAGTTHPSGVSATVQVASADALRR